MPDQLTLAPPCYSLGQGFYIPEVYNDKIVQQRSDVAIKLVS